MAENYWVFFHINAECDKNFESMMKKESWQFTKKIKDHPKKEDKIIFYLSNGSKLKEKKRYFAGQAVISEFLYRTTRESVDAKKGVWEAQFKNIKRWDRKVNFDEVKLNLEFIKESMAKCPSNPKSGIGLAFQGKQMIKIYSKDYNFLTGK